MVARVSVGKSSGAEMEPPETRRRPRLRLECARHGREHRSRPAPTPRTPSPGSASWKDVARL